jgi:hypothetical protein
MLRRGTGSSVDVLLFTFRSCGTVILVDHMRPACLSDCEPCRPQLGLGTSKIPRCYVTAEGWGGGGDLSKEYTGSCNTICVSLLKALVVMFMHIYVRCLRYQVHDFGKQFFFI